MRRRIAWITLAVLVLLVVALSVLWWQRRLAAQREAHEAVLAYIRQTEPYSEQELWPLLPALDPRTLTQTHHLLTQIEPPAAMVEAHANLVEGYAFIFEGQRWILMAISANDGELRAEGEFLVDWGLSRVQEHYRVIEAYRAEH